MDFDSREESRRRVRMAAVERMFTPPVKRVSNPIEFYESSFKNTPSSQEELIKRLGIRWKHNISRLGSIVEVYKHITANYIKDSTKFPTILSISCTNGTLLEIFGNKMNVSDTIRLARKAGLVQCVSEKYRWGNWKWKFSKQYAWNKSVERMVLDLVKEYDLPVKNHARKEYVSDNESNENESPVHDKQKNSKKVKVSSKLRISKIRKNDTVSALGFRYSDTFHTMKDWSKLMNIGNPNIEQHIKLDWNLHYSKKGYLTKVGMRATSMVCSTRVHENGKDKRGCVMRKDYMDSIFGIGKWDSYDVRGSIYQVAHLMSHGEWLGNKVDPYEIMFGKFSSETERTAMKEFAMCLYFDYRNQIINHNRKRIKASLNLFGKELLQQDINNSIEDMEKFTGKSLDSEVFFFESGIYLNFMYHLKKYMGLKVVQVYDCFYFEKGAVTKEILEDVLKTSAMEFYEIVKKSNLLNK